MRHSYKDIFDRIAEPPKWFDENGVPRYSGFIPGKFGDITREAALVEIRCSWCVRRFIVALDDRHAEKSASLSDMIRLGIVCYGEPPNIGCCPTGPHHPSRVNRILAYWWRDPPTYPEWRRDAAFEGPLPKPVTRYGDEPENTELAVLAAVDAGHRAIRVDCTSEPSRRYLSGRVAAAMMKTARVLFTCHESLRGSATRTLDDLVPWGTIGRASKPGRIALVCFEELAEFSPDLVDAIIVLTGQPSLIFLAGPPSTPTFIQAQKEAAEHAWRQAKKWLADAAAGRVLIDFRLSGRPTLIESPDAVIDGWQGEVRTRPPVSPRPLSRR